MKLNRFKIRIIFQNLAIAFLGYLTVSSFFNEHLWLTRITFLIIWLALIFNLIRYVSRTNERLKTFLASINYPDTMPVDNDGDLSYKELNLTLNEIISKIKDAEKDKEIQAIYFKNTIEHVGTGLISYNEEGKINMYNKAARQLLALPVLSDISSLNTLKPGIEDEIRELQPGENLLAAIVIKGELHRIIFRKAIVKIQTEIFNVLSLQDIRSQLEEEEIETWQKLISILRHEIMNSVAPINSLSVSLRKIVDRIQMEVPRDQAIMIKDGLEAISRRSDGLMSFVKAYKTLTSIPKPKFTEFPAKKILDDSLILFKPEIEDRKIKLNLIVRENPIIIADYDLISQVIINLIKNALEALDEKGGEISLTIARNDQGYTNISVKDTGKGIPEDQIESIFIPFYTTKENGNGIGLSLARQIMRLHKGNIRANSKYGDGSEFILSF